MGTRAFFLALITSVVQYYNYQLFMCMAADISKYFFVGELVQQLTNTYLVISLGALGKPFVALLIGYIGDIYGKRITTIISLSAVAAASIVVALVPSYASIGVLAPLILTGARIIITGFAPIGTDGLRLYIFDKIAGHRKALGTGLIGCASMLGGFTASLSSQYFSSEVPSDNWRVAFGIGAISSLLLAIKYLWNNEGLGDNYAKRDAGYEHYKNSSIFSVINQNRSLVLLCILVAGGIGTTYQFSIFFLSNYVSKILNIIPSELMQNYRTISIGLYMVGAILGGALADRFGCIKILILGASIFLSLCGLQIFYLLNNDFSPICYLLSSAYLPFITMSALVGLQSSIPLAIRYRLFSLSHALGALLISTHTLLIANIIYQYSQVTWLPMVYLLLITSILACATYLLHKRYGLNAL